jgi:hypothetical protein
MDESAVFETVYTLGNFFLFYFVSSQTIFQYVLENEPGSEVAGSSFLFTSQPFLIGQPFVHCDSTG